MAAPINRNPVGPLRVAQLTRVDGVLFWDRTRPGHVMPHGDDHDYIIQIGDRTDSLAYAELEDDAIGHLIMLRNNMRLWPNDFVPGKRIQIPTHESLSERGFI